MWQEGLTANGLPRVSKIGENVLVEVNTAVRKLAELSSLLDLCWSIQSVSAILLSYVRGPLCPGHSSFANVNPSHPHLIID
jgi:hypothetical protein